jgi:hypothetical protein
MLIIMVHYGTKPNHSFTSDYLSNLHSCLLKITFQSCHSPAKQSEYTQKKRKLNKLAFQNSIIQSGNKFFDKQTQIA